MVTQIIVLIVFVLVQMVVAAAVANLYFRVFFLDPLLRQGRVSPALRLVTLLQVVVMATAMVLIFERILLLASPAAAEPSLYWNIARKLIVAFTFIGNFDMQVADDTRRLAAMLRDKQAIERITKANEEKGNKA